MDLPTAGCATCPYHELHALTAAHRPPHRAAPPEPYDPNPNPNPDPNPNLTLPLPLTRPSQRDRLMEAFRAADGDGSGTISKRELYKILEVTSLNI